MLDEELESLKKFWQIIITRNKKETDKKEEIMKGSV